MVGGHTHMPEEGIYTYTHIQRERERETERNGHTHLPPSPAQKPREEPKRGRWHLYCELLFLPATHTQVGE